MKKPLISIIIPVYNVEKYIGKCIESIINQTYKNLEIILVDDGSTDNSQNICKSYQEKDTRIIIVKKENGGLASARNEGLKYIHGKYVGFVDSDDWVELDTYEVMYKAILKHPNFIITSGRYNVNEVTGTREPLFQLSNEQIWSKTESIKNFLTWNNIDASVCDKLFPIEIISNLSFPNGLVSEDVLFTFRSLERSNGVIHIGSCKYNYLQRNGSITHSKFTEKTKGLIVYPEEIWNMVYKNHANLKEAADYYRFSRLIIYIKLMYLNGIIEKEELKMLRSNLFLILNNKFFSIKQKFIALLIKFHMFGFVIKIYKMFYKGE